VLIALLDTMVALLAGMAIFPIVFANGLEPGAGPGLIFQTLPIAFGAMPGGNVFGSLFFLLLVFAAWTSAISLIEPAAAWLVENMQMSRVRAAIWVGVSVWLLGLATVFSFNIWEGVKPLSMFENFRDSTIFDLLDYLTANIMLPLGGLMIAVFAGWVMSRASTVDELGMGDKARYRIWRWVLRYVTPVAVVIVFLRAVEVI
jgi:NSS family neurotransmitter:Na+ symporter